VAFQKFLLVRGVVDAFWAKNFWKVTVHHGACVKLAAVAVQVAMY
jgi:hypothetical protein